MKVAVKQALRQLGYSYAKIAALTNVCTRTAWNHCQALPGSNVRAWDKRSDEEKKAALIAAEELLKS
jgi:hypothetical protein